MSMDKWEEAAGTAALNIGATRCSTETLPTEVVKIRDDIVTAHSDLRWTFGKLVELAATNQQLIEPWNLSKANLHKFVLRRQRLYADPDIQAAIQKGEEG